MRPWDSDRIPVELTRLVNDAAPDLAVDLRSGSGAQARYLADLGWQETAVDYVPEAIASARHGDPSGTVRWRLADVTMPDQVDPAGALTGRIRLVLDNGCLHRIPPGCDPAGRPQ